MRTIPILKYAGAGGTESQDWASMLLRMYTRWAERSGRKVEVMEVHYGEEAGIKSASILISGHNSYGMAKTNPAFIVWCVFRLTI